VEEEREIGRLLGRLRIRGPIRLHCEKVNGIPQAELAISQEMQLERRTEEAPGLDIRRSCWWVRSC
jgi:hypothetical protein